MRDPDPRTVARAREGDLAAFEEIVRLLQPDVYAFAWHLTRDRSLAEDVAQDAFIRAFRFVKGFRGEQRFGSWLFRIVRNCAMDALRGRSRWTALIGDGPERTVPDPTARIQLETALRSVSAEHREAFLLVEVFGLSYQETADVLGVAVGTVKSRMFRARRALSEAISDEEVEAT
jgi:RNA polymerase sigma-70 factor (ECF subfamily)